MIMLPAFSVLLSVYTKDRPAWVRDALVSALSNTVKPTEVVIMVDGPIEAELQAVLDQATQNKTVRILSHPAYMGRGAALSMALPQCRHELVALMDANAVCRPNRFERQLAVFTATPDVAVCGGQIQEVNADNFSPLSQHRVPLTNRAIRQHLKTRMPFNNQTVMFKKSALLDSGNFQPFGLLDDYYMWVRVLAKGYQAVNIPDILADMRVNPVAHKSRGGYNYFHMNKLLFDKMRQLHLLNAWEYYYTLSVRFVAQVLMPNWLKSLFFRGKWALD